MMLDIFSSFDPGFYSFSGGYKMIMFWVVSVMGVFIIMIKFWASPSRLTGVVYFLSGCMCTQSRRTMGGHIKGFSSVLSALFLFIIIVNFLGLIPYMFSASSHLVYSLAFGLPMWLSLILSGAVAFTSSFLAHLLPGGAPGWLDPFLVLVESVSIMLRSITLSFRLAANMSAGHIALTLMGVYASSAVFLSPGVFLILVLIQMFYILFEMGICLIQSYIFCLLASLYSDDHPSL
uniref:ATP synthase subunit a n=1 Tax=Auchenoplax crinita TaxID=397536 RepID=G8XXL4_AUCCR|nr:ATP synthase F0 subunit 6 [Auchenoplax crinita]